MVVAYAWEPGRLWVHHLSRAGNLQDQDEIVICVFLIVDIERTRIAGSARWAPGHLVVGSRR